METIFSKNKQFRCRATRELPAHPQDMSGWGEGAQQQGGWPGKSWGSEEEVRGGAWRLQRGGTIRASHSLTPPPILESSQVPIVPNTPSELSQSFLLSDLQPPYCRGPGPPTTKENPSQSAGARAVGTWEDGPGGTPVGHEGGAGAPGAAELVLFSPRCLSISVLLYLSPRLCLCVSLYFFLPVSPRLYPHSSVLQRLEHVVTKCRKFGLHLPGGSPPIRRPRAWRQGAGLEQPAGRLEVGRDQVSKSDNSALPIRQPHQVGNWEAQKCAVTCPGSRDG